MSQGIHPIFKNQPAPEKTTKLWRYLSISKFITLLEARCLHFTRIDQYKSTDHFEGIWPKSDLEFWKTKGTAMPAFTDGFNRKTAASCWIEQNYESAAMWQLYGLNKEGIAITTTYEKLTHEIGQANLGQYVDIAGAGRVQYINHLNEGVIENLKPDDLLPNGLLPFMLKNISYEHEKEVRALLIANLANEIEESGADIPIDLNFLIDEIIISPAAESWFYDPLNGLLNKYNMATKLKRSSLSKENFYASAEKKI
jgi:hypothetical protein